MRSGLDWGLEPYSVLSTGNSGADLFFGLFFVSSAVLCSCAHIYTHSNYREGVQSNISA